MLLFSNDSKHTQFFVTDRFVSNIYLKLRRSCQLPDFSLRSQTFFFPADFPTTFLYMPKTTTFSHLITKQPASTLEFQYFVLYFAKQFSVSPDKNGKSAPASLAPPVPGQAYGRH